MNTMVLSDLPLPEGLSVFSCFLVLFLVSGNRVHSRFVGQVKHPAETLPCWELVAGIT